MRPVKIQMSLLDDGGAVFTVEGELDAYTGPQLREALGEALAAGTRRLFVDLGAEEYMDSVGLGILVGMAKRAGENAGGLAVVAPRANVKRVFEVSGTSELLNVVEDLAAAQARVCPAVASEGGNEA